MFVIQFTKLLISSDVVLELLNLYILPLLLIQSNIERLQQNLKQFQKIRIVSGMNLGREQQNMLHDAAGLAMSLGLCKASYDNENRTLSHIPISFYPYLIDFATYYKLKKVHYIWQKLFVKVGANRQFVKDLSNKFCKDDPYMEKLLAIYQKQSHQNVGVACTRVDYMGDHKPQLVEYNLMSVGLNGMSDRIQTLQSILRKYDTSNGKFTYPQNKNQQTICNALILALQNQKLTQGLILMVVHQKQFNYGDHHAFRIQMLKKGRQAQPITMLQLIQKMKYDEATGDATLDGKHIDAFYFRTGYSLSHFPTQKHWQIRYQIERSRSIKLPSIEMILINSKRMQSQLAKENILKKFLSQQQAQAILSVSGQIHDFDDKSEQQIMALIDKTKQQDYVLKPNREGGGNNFFSKKAHEKIKQLYDENLHEHLKNHILMKKIKSQVHQNYFIFDHKPIYVSKTTAEFSTLGAFVYNQGQIIFNQMGGTLVRLKRQEVQQGGIAINQGAISGVCILNYD